MIQVTAGERLRHGAEKPTHSPQRRRDRGGSAEKKPICISLRPSASSASSASLRCVSCLSNPYRKPIEIHGNTAITMSARNSASRCGQIRPIAWSGATLPIAQAASPRSGPGLQARTRTASEGLTPSPLWGEGGGEGRRGAAVVDSRSSPPPSPAQRERVQRQRDGEDAGGSRSQLKPACPNTSPAWPSPRRRTCHAIPCRSRPSTRHRGTTWSRGS